MASDFYTRIIKELDAIKKGQSYRFLKTIEKHDGKYITYNGKKYLNLSSNDYLGLGSDIDLHEQFYQSMDKKTLPERFGPGSTSSRLLTGDYTIYQDLEQELCNLYTAAGKNPSTANKKAALTFNSGYHANTGIIPSLAKHSDLVLSDRLNHASIIDGTRLAKAETVVYDHLDYAGLEQILNEKHESYNNIFIVTESVFSMDGDTADLKRLTDIKKKYNAILYVDEAHSFGTAGDRGLGISEEQQVIDEIDIIVNTFGKATGSMGACAIVTPELKDYLINTMRTLIFTTALPPVIINWNLFIISHLSLYNKRMKHLKVLSARLRKNLMKSGLTVTGDSHIVPVITGTNDKTVSASEKLMDAGFLLFPVRPPTVPEGSSRIRISLRADIE